MFDILLLTLSLQQGRPEKLRGPGQRVKVGPQGQGGLHFELYNFTQAVRRRPKKKGHYILTMTISTPASPTISPYLYACYTATLKNTVTALLEYIDLLRRYSRGRYPGAPFRLGLGEKYLSFPPPLPCGWP